MSTTLFTPEELKARQVLVESPDRPDLAASLLHYILFPDLAQEIAGRASAVRRFNAPVADKMDQAVALLMQCQSHLDQRQNPPGSAAQTPAESPAEAVAV